MTGKKLVMQQLLRHPQDQNLLLVNVRTCSVGRTQQWPTELTGRYDSHWLSIHRSSPRVPSRPLISSSEIPQEQTQEKTTIFDNSRVEALRCVRWLSAGNSTSTGTGTASTWSCCYIQQAPEGSTSAESPVSLQVRSQRDKLMMRSALQGGWVLLWKYLR